MSNIQIHSSREAAEASQTEPAAAGGHNCECGGTNEALPEVDVQTIPHAVRHSAIFGMLDGLAPGNAVVLSATHEPRPLLAQLEERSPGVFSANYMEEGPERWRLKVERLLKA